MQGAPERSDINCSGGTNVADVQLITTLALDLDLSLTIDVNQDRCPDSCDMCGAPQQPEGTPCDDGNPCTGDGACFSGACFEGPLLPCVAQDECHVPGVCNPISGLCTNPLNADGTSCDDGDPCTINDSCDSGICQGGGFKFCPSLDSCNVGACESGTGACGIQALPDGSSCDDGNPCTQTDQCIGGTCVGTNPVVCSSLDQCHVAGICNPSTGQCSNPPVSNGVFCDDGDSCTQIDACINGSCIGLNPKVCHATDACHSPGTCDPATGQCSDPDAPNGTPCDDGDACTVVDSCIGGTCVGQVPLVCSALDACHVPGVCNPTTGQCTNPLQADGTTCDDGDACTQVDACQGGLCVGTDPRFCTPADTCHVGVCDPSDGSCSDVAKEDGSACFDGDACTQSDACVAGTCVGVNPVICTPLNQCHDVGECNTSTGVCSNPMLADGTSCTDGTACTTGDQCNQGACVPGVPTICVAAGPCYDVGTCDPISGACSQPEKPQGTACDDGDACTQVDACVAGTCEGFDPVICPTSGQCYDDAVCDTATGQCASTQKPDGTVCEDGDFATCPDLCAAGTCESGPPAQCEDGNPCTDNFCILGDCEFTSNNLPCGIAELCLLGECFMNLCLVDADPCNDDNPCTDDACDGAGGCLNVPNTQGCSDGNPCTVGDACVSGFCLGIPKDCSTASGQCTTGVCDPATGACTGTAANGVLCDDGDACTINDVCEGGQCSGSLFPACLDPDVHLLCAITGTAGQVVECPIRVARTIVNSAPATGLQLELEYDSTLRLQYFSDGEFCFGPQSCIPYTVPIPFTSLQSGHSLIPNIPIANWGHEGGLILVHLSQPTTALSDAAFVGSQVVGDDLVMTAHFELLQDVPSDTPAVVSAPFVAASSAEAESFPATVYDLRIVTCSEGANCATLACDASDPLSCDDGNFCTDDTCVGGFGCTHEERTGACDDGNLCTQADQCVAGLCLGVPTPCEDDGDPCTVATCNPATGACGVPAPTGTPCDDGVPCTFPDTCSLGDCAGPYFPACADPAERILCILTGEAGDEVSCPFRLTRSAQVSPLPTGLHVDFAYPTTVSLLRLVDGEFCPAPEFCLPWLIPDFFPTLQSGHSIIFGPDNLASWSGGGGAVFVNLTEPTSALNYSYLIGASEWWGDFDTFELVFQLGADFPPEAPAIVRATKMSASDFNAEPLNTVTTDLLTVVAPPPQ